MVPRQDGLAEAEIVIPTGNIESTVTGYWMLVAGLLIAQVSEEVRVQDTRSPFTGMYVKIPVVVPTHVPLTFH